MKDNELRGLVLQRFYDLRHSPEGVVQLNEIAKLDPNNPQLIANICDQLYQHNLITWNAMKGMMGNTFSGLGKITAFGVDVVEGTTRPPISIIVHDQSITVSQSSNVQVGSDNKQTTKINLGDLHKAIDNSSASAADKAEAKTFVEKLTTNPAFVAVVSAIMSMAGSGHAN